MAIVTGYYCTDRTTAAALTSTGVGFVGTLDERDWLGLATYFYQEPSVARKRAIERSGGAPLQLAIVECDIDLRDCLDFLDPRVAASVRNAEPAFLDYEQKSGIPVLPQARMRVVDRLVSFAQPMPSPYASASAQSPYVNRRDAMFLDWYISDLAKIEGKKKTCIRAAFVGGRALFRESLIFDEVHIQIAVKDLGVVIKPRPYTLEPA